MANRGRPREVEVTGYPPGTTIAELNRAFCKFGLMRVINMDALSAVIWFQSGHDVERLLRCSSVYVSEHCVKIKPHICPVYNYRKKMHNTPQIPTPNTNTSTIEVSQIEKSVTPRSKSRRRHKSKSPADLPAVARQHPPQPTKEKKEKRQKYITNGQVPLIEPSQLDLSGDFNTQVETIINSIRLTREEVEKLYTLYLDVEQCLQTLWPGCVAVPFGSITTGLGVKSSDADCFIRLPAEHLPATPTHVLDARHVLAARPDLFARVVAVPNAATPIVKFLHLPTETFCDVSMRSTLGVRNSRLVAHLLAADNKFGPLALLLKYWARVRQLSGTGKISNYALVLLLVFYLQRVGRLPAVRALQARPHSHVPAGDWDAGFSDDRALLPAQAPGGLLGLLRGFFRFYAAFNFDKFVVSPYLGDAIPKRQFRIPAALTAFPLYRSNVAAKRSSALNMRLMCVQDPFEHSHNVAACVSGSTLAIFMACVRSAARSSADAALVLPALLLGASPVPAVKVSVSGSIVRRWPVPRVEDSVLRLLRDVLRLSVTMRHDGLYDAVMQYDVFDRKPFDKLYRDRRELTCMETQKQITDNMIKLGAARLSTQLQLDMRVSQQTGVCLWLEHAAGEPDTLAALGRCLHSSLKRWLRRILLEDDRSTRASTQEIEAVVAGSQEEEDDDSAESIAGEVSSVDDEIDAIDARLDGLTINT